MMVVVVVIIFLMIILQLNYKVVKESIHVMSSIGIQRVTTYASGRNKVYFYDNCYIDDVVVAEAVNMVYFIQLKCIRS